MGCGWRSRLLAFCDWPAFVQRASPPHSTTFEGAGRLPADYSDAGFFRPAACRGPRFNAEEVRDHKLARNGKEDEMTRQSGGGNDRKRADHECLYNSLNLAFTHDDLTYCEGLALVHNVPGWMRHSWCAAPNGTVVDVTWREPGAEYFGAPIDARAAARAVRAQGRTWSWILQINSGA